MDIQDPTNDNNNGNSEHNEENANTTSIHEESPIPENLLNFDTTQEDEEEILDGDDETRPFLGSDANADSNAVGDSDIESQDNNGASFASTIRSRARSNTMFSLRSGIEIVKEHMDKEKFVLLILASLFFYFGFFAAFAPRSSLAKTLGWLHGSLFTRAETYRIFLNSLQEHNKAENYMHAFSELSSQSGSQQRLDYTVTQLHNLGFSPKIESYYPWMNKPGYTGVTLYNHGKKMYKASMFEECLTADKSQCSNMIRGYHSYSASGNIMKRYVFCNYGTLKDYKLLLENGIDIEGKIHIIRNSKTLKGIKVKNAELFGASGVILYSDPYDDGYVTERNGFKAYPNGPARNPSAIERGSVQYLEEYPGDPTTPEFSSKFKHTEHNSPAGLIPTIPSVPMSAKEVKPILELLNGKGFQLGPGGYIEGFDYFTGPSADGVEVHIINEQKYELQKVSNIITEIPGIFAEGEIIIGARRDSLGDDGSVSSGSGTAILLEIARGFADLMKKGWKPLRPIKLVSWDASGPARIGSTEYVEEYSAFLQRNVLAYLNLDKVIQGSLFTCNANPLLKEAIYEAAKYTAFKGREDWTLFDEWRSMSNNDIGIIDGVTDTNAFQNHLGIPSANFQFKNNGTGDAIFHTDSNYDSIEWLEKYADPDYKLHNTMAKFVGLVTLVINQNELIPFATHSYLKQINSWFIRWNTKLLSSFPHDNELQELAKSVHDIIDIATKRESVLFDKKIDEIKEGVVQEFPLLFFYKKIKIYMDLIRVNNKLQQLDKLFLTKKGLNDRTWLKHSIFEPGKFSGFKGMVLPGLYESIEEWSRDDAMQWLKILLIQFSNIRLLLQV